jgi:hypothetical protein
LHQGSILTNDFTEDKMNNSNVNDEPEFIIVKKKMAMINDLFTENPMYPFTVSEGSLLS